MDARTSVGWQVIAYNEYLPYFIIIIIIIID